MRIFDGPMPLGGFCLSIFVGNILYQAKREEMITVWMDRGTQADIKSWGRPMEFWCDDDFGAK